MIEKESKKTTQWYDDSNFITNTSICLLALIIINTIL